MKKPKNSKEPFVVRTNTLLGQRAEEEPVEEEDFDDEDEE